MHTNIDDEALRPDLEEINRIYDRLQAKTAELDTFVYHAAHTLRGPLATVKGLINLSRYTTDLNELKFLIGHMESFAEQLDKKLYRLIYFAESDKAGELAAPQLSVYDLIRELSAFFNEVNIDGSMVLDCQVEENGLAVSDGTALLSLLRNLVGFFTEQSRRAKHCTLQVHARTGPVSCEFTIHATGCSLDAPFRAKVAAENVGYPEILNYPELINVYAAKKILLKLRGKMVFTVPGPETMMVTVTVPGDKAVLLP